jgi:hypothetical protein
MPHCAPLHGSPKARRHSLPKLIRVARAFLALSAALVVIAFLAGYFVYYRSKLAPAETEAALRADAMRGVQCERGWRRVSTWTYVCTIHWRDGTLVTGHVEVDAHHVTSEDMLP